MQRDVIERLDRKGHGADGSGAGMLWNYLNMIGEDGDSICDTKTWGSSRRNWFFELVRDVVGFDPDNPPPGYTPADD